MRFGIREICEVVLRAKAKMIVGSKTFYKDEPVLYFDSLKTSSLEGNATTVYAEGGRGNTRLLAWEGERTLTFNFTDALISPESFSVLSGASVLEASASEPMYVHTTSRVEVKSTGTGDQMVVYVEVPGKAAYSHKARAEFYKAGADIFLMKVDGNEMSAPEIPYDGPDAVKYNSETNMTKIECYAFAPGSTVLVDYYTIREAGKQIEITPDKFGGFFYLEASSLFRDETTGQDLPAEFVIPRCKIQSNFTFSMASTGDPSTFEFVLDAFPDYTKFDPTKKVLAILQVIEETEDADDAGERKHLPKKHEWDTEDGEFDHKTGYELNDASYAKDDDEVASSDF